MGGSRLGYYRTVPIIVRYHRDVGQMKDGKSAASHPIRSRLTSVVQSPIGEQSTCIIWYQAHHHSQTLPHANGQSAGFSKWANHTHTKTWYWYPYGTVPIPYSTHYRLGRYQPYLSRLENPSPTLLSYRSHHQIVSLLARGTTVTRFYCDSNEHEECSH
jgi:hypothetical protein